MDLYVVDFETDSLTHSTVIHVMSIGWKDSEGDWQVASTKDHDHIKAILENKDNIIVGHFFKMFDVPQVELVLGIKVKAKIYDTIPLAWYVFPKRKKSFGLDAFGQEYGIEKPKIDPKEWAGPLPGETREEFDDKMKHRCEEDVKINIELWEDILNRLIEIYGSWEKAEPFVNYLMFKSDCLADQQQIKTRVDMERVHDNIRYLKPLITEKEVVLKKAMPPGKVDKKKPTSMHRTVKKKRPSVTHKQGGELSAAGKRWFDYLEENKVPKKDQEDLEVHEKKELSANGTKWVALLKELGLPEDTEAIHEEPNPQSHDQLKKWLFKLGWKPQIFKDGANGPVPQLRDSEKDLCQSVMELAEEEPAIEALDGLTVLTHRLGCLKALLDTSDYYGYTIAGASGFTNTLRLKHVKPIVNLPGVTSSDNDPIEKRSLRDGRTVRECIIAKDGHVLCGSDISSLEDQTKRHYMWEYDPDYVTEQMKEGYDPHLDLAVRAGAMTEEQVEEHKLYKKTKGKEGVDHSGTRHIYKTANYSCIYGVGIATLGASTKLPQRQARKLRQDYWDRNWSIKEMVKDLIVKKTKGDQMWLLNPVNHFWYSVRNDKDLFSTLNQGTGSFVFDLWVNYMVNEGYKPFIQYHDEVLLNVKKGEEEAAQRDLTEAMVKVNEMLDLNITIGVDVQFGKTYADVH